MLITEDLQSADPYLKTCKEIDNLPISNATLRKIYRAQTDI